MSMHNNLHYFNYSKEHPEPLFDPYYAKNMVVIPLRREDENELTLKNQRLIDLITAFQVAISMGKDRDDTIINEIVEEVQHILDKTDNINFSAFCQFFMVQNSSYSAYKSIPSSDRGDFIYEMLIRFCNERHNMYKSHGYSNVSLQVVCDSYSHKRNSKTSIVKFESMLKPYDLKVIRDPSRILIEDDYYFLPDKTGRRCFDALLSVLDIKMESRGIEQGKRPDIVFKHGGHYYIFELKMMKGGGGGQNKQAVEFAYFIKFAEEDARIHYGILLDSLYANDLFYSMQPKIVSQRNDVLVALKENPGNYFVNTAGAEVLLQDIFR